MTREEKFNETIKHFTKEDQDIIKKDSAVGLSFLILQDFYEARLKAKDERIERLTIRLKLIKEMSDVNEKIINDKDEEIKELGEIVQQYLIPSKNYDAIIKAKNEEIVKLKLELFRSSPKIANKKSHSIVAMLFWEWKKIQRYSGKNHSSVRSKEDAFKKAYVMLKEK